MHLGIDLGTSNSAIVAYDGGNLRLIKTADGTDVLPTAFYVDARGHRFVGRRAYEQAASNPDNVAREFKRIMGTSTPIRLGGGSVIITPEEASAEIIRALLTQARTELGDREVEGTIITIPAAFNQMQSEATIAAADLAGVTQVGLLHEPIAAAMASMANAQMKSGQFLVYDLGGGTFDVALVQASNGMVNIVAHEGVNMLGGKDFDALLMAEVVSPWLEHEFSLDESYRESSDYARLLKRIKLRAEQAKIELSSRDSSIIFIGDDELRFKDRNGRDVYIEVEVERSVLERLVRPKIDRTIELCRKVISDNGYTSADLDRVVLVGGPTKMPIVRDLIPQVLGLPVDLATDPMIAVATGAAIFAESREWGGGETRRKASRASVTTSAGLDVKFDYPARVTAERAQLRVTTQESGAGWRVSVSGEDGWNSGVAELAEAVRIELPLRKMGENAFTAVVTGPAGQSHTTKFKVARAHASSAGVPATLTISIVIEEDAGGARREQLDPLIRKGTLLPASGRESYRAGRSLVGGTDDYIDVKVYQSPDDISDPALGLLVGAFRLSAREHLSPGATIREGQEIEVDWQMNDSGLLKATVVVPGERLMVEVPTYFSAAAGHKDFSGAEGADLAQGLVNEAAHAIESIADAVGDHAWAELQQLRDRVEEQRRELDRSADPDARRKAAEESLAIRQEVDRIRRAPPNRVAVISKELAVFEEILEEISPTVSDAHLLARCDQLSSEARRHLDAGQTETAWSCVNQIKSLVFAELMRRPGFIVEQFESLASDRFLAVDKALHDRLVLLGRDLVNGGDWDGLRRVNRSLSENRFATASVDDMSSQLVGLVKGGRR